MLHQLTSLPLRAGLAFATALVIALVFGGMIIKWIRKHQIGETIRNLGLEGQMSKKGTPTMGGIIIILALTVSAFLFCRLDNIYVQLLLLTTFWCGAIGFTDDYIKVFKHNKAGMPGPVKIVFQVILGLIIAGTVCVNDDIVAGRTEAAQKTATEETEQVTVNEVVLEKSTATTFPFIKNHTFDYNWLNPFKGDFGQTMRWIIYGLIIILVVFFGSNGTNLTDGLDGLAAGSSVISSIMMIVLAGLGTNIVTAEHFRVMFIPGSEEIAIYLSAFAGAVIGFLYYNVFPAKVFMGDTGSLVLGGIMGVSMVLLRKELLLPVLCGVFAVEGLSVMLQRYYFKYTKHRYGEGKRIFKMTPLHHHFQKEGIPALIQRPAHAIKETKIVASFWAAGIVCALLTWLLVWL